MRFFEFAPSADRDHNDDVPDPIFVLANRWWNATDRQPQIEHVLNSLGWSIHQNESEDDGVQLQHRDGTTHYISADEFDPDLFEYQKPKIQRANRDGIDLSFEKIKDDEYVSDDDDENTVAQVTATSNGKELGHVLFSIDGNTLLPQDLEVDERYRGQGIAKIMYDYVKSLGYQIRRSGQQTDAGAGFWSKHRPSQNVWETELDEISDELRRNYLHRAGKHVDRRMDHMARVRDRLNKGYEIYHADRPAGSAQIVDRFEADTPALAQQYYEKFIRDYVSDVDFDLRLRRSTGIIEEGWREKVAAGALGAAALWGGQQVDKYISPDYTTTPQPSIQQQYNTPQQRLTPVQVLTKAAEDAGIKGIELTQFLAQCAHESANFTRMEEIGNPQYFKKKYENPRKAKILGNKFKGDGERYKGRGPIQLTGRDNYTRAGAALGLPLAQNPELLLRPDIGAKASVWFWKNHVAPKVQDFSNTRAVTKKINPGLKGQKARQQQFDKYTQLASR
jgi:putative chitinase